MIGSGIFSSPGLLPPEFSTLLLQYFDIGSVLAHTHSPGLALMAWLVAGVLSLLGLL